MSTITRSLATAFGGSVNLDTLRAEITANVTITTAINGASLDGDDVAMHFASAPGGGEITELDTVVIPSHVSASTSALSQYGTYNGFHNSSNGKVTADTADASYQSLSSFPFLGMDTVACPHVDLLAHVGSGGTGAFRIWDNTNSVTIVEKTDITNTSLAVIELGDASGCSSGPAVWEFQHHGDGVIKMKSAGVNLRY